ncbi:hypothetical protein TrLO_g7220 [Triparma laevis f. longispina]|uniref:Uncharacterized protein n=1 Tax=Triparma laevis f. longispina TaxID=1714387 RepID=A0A9W7DVI6_9STRA|nr:hypothetical protein TrLO_g7220 [Triparma laevis f. longispina]
MIDSVGKEEAEDVDGDGGADEANSNLPPPSPRADEEKKVVLEPNRISSEELSIALCKSGLISVGGDGKADADAAQIENLVKEIETILGNKPSFVVSEKDAANIDWKALELLGDEKLMDEAREAPAVNVSHSNSDHNKKALGMLGTVKAVDSKKVRNRLGSDMSTDQLKRQQMAEVAASHKGRESNILNDIKNHLPEVHIPHISLPGMGGSPRKKGGE